MKKIRRQVHFLGDKEHFYESWQFYPKHGYVEYSPNYMRKELKQAELWDIYDFNRNKTGRTVERGKPPYANLKAEQRQL